MTSAPEDIDWDSVRDKAMECLDSVWSVICFENASQDADYDIERAVAHLAAIDEAIVSFKLASLILSPGYSLTQDSSVRHSLAFDSLALATVGEGARPGFQFGPESRFGGVFSATAHEAAFELLRMALLSKESALIEVDLHDLSPPVLQVILTKWGEYGELSKLIDSSEIRQLKSWVNREWAAVKAGQSSGVQSPSVTQDPLLAGDAVTSGVLSHAGPNCPSKYVFKKEGHFWTIGFDGDGLVRGIKDVKAVRDIQYVLSMKKVDVQHLPENAGVATRETSDTPVATKDDWIEFQKQILSRKRELETVADQLVKKELEQEISALENQLNQNFNKNGDPRELSGDLTKVKEKTQRRVNEWKKANVDRFPKLIAHLDLHLEISGDCSYSPPDETPWDFGEN